MWPKATTATTIKYLGTTPTTASSWVEARGEWHESERSLPSPSPFSDNNKLLPASETIARHNTITPAGPVTTTITTTSKCYLTIELKKKLGQTFFLILSRISYAVRDEVEENARKTVYKLARFVYVFVALKCYYCCCCWQQVKNVA